MLYRDMMIDQEKMNLIRKLIRNKKTSYLNYSKIRNKLKKEKTKHKTHTKEEKLNIIINRSQLFYWIQCWLEEGGNNGVEDKSEKTKKQKEKRYNERKNKEQTDIKTFMRS